MTMHAAPIIQDLLREGCPSIHAKRRKCIADLVEAGRTSGLTLIGMSRVLNRPMSVRHRLKCCDRLLSNPHLVEERFDIYRAMNERVLARQESVVVNVSIDWSDLFPDRRAVLLRAAVTVAGRSSTVYQEVHPGNELGSRDVHRQFLIELKKVLPDLCRPILITDAGFRATWFQLADELHFPWVGRVRNLDMVRPTDSSEWVGAKTLYEQATGRAKDLGLFTYARSNPTDCRLVIIKRKKKGRHQRTKMGKPCCSSHAKKSRSAQIEPWLLATSKSLSSVSATRIVAIYSGRMQIEQTFRDTKNPRSGLGLANSQTKKVVRLEVLVLLGALITYTLWLIGLAVKKRGYDVTYGSKKRASTTLSIVSLGLHCLNEVPQRCLSKRELKDALSELVSMVVSIEI